MQNKKRILGSCTRITKILSFDLRIAPERHIVKSQKSIVEKRERNWIGMTGRKSGTHVVCGTTEIKTNMTWDLRRGKWVY